MVIDIVVVIMFVIFIIIDIVGNFFVCFIIKVNKDMR